MCGLDLERCEDKIVMSGNDKVPELYKRNKRNCVQPDDVVPVNNKQPFKMRLVLKVVNLY